MVAQTYDPDLIWAMLTECATAVAGACGMVPVGDLRWQSGHHELRLDPVRRTLRLQRRGAMVTYAIRWWVADDLVFRASVTGRPPARVIADLAAADELTGGRLLTAWVRAGQVLGGSQRLRHRLGLGGER